MESPVRTSLKISIRSATVYSSNRASLHNANPPVPTARPCFLWQAFSADTPMADPPTPGTLAGHGSCFRNRLFGQATSSNYDRNCPSQGSHRDQDSRANKSRVGRRAQKHTYSPSTLQRELVSFTDEMYFHLVEWNGETNVTQPGLLIDKGGAPRRYTGKWGYGDKSNSALGHLDRPLRIGQQVTRTDISLASIDG